MLKLVILVHKRWAVWEGEGLRVSDTHPLFYLRSIRSGIRAYCIISCYFSRYNSWWCAATPSVWIPGKACMYYKPLRHNNTPKPHIVSANTCFPKKMLLFPQSFPIISSFGSTMSLCSYSVTFIINTFYILPKNGEVVPTLVKENQTFQMKKKKHDKGSRKKKLTLHS